MESQFWDIVKAAVPEATITGWVMMVEIRDSDKPKLKLVTSDLMTPWAAEGMMNRGLEILAQMEEDFAEDED